MSLLEAICALSADGGARRLQRSHLYTAVTRVLLHLFDSLRMGDVIRLQGRVYTLQRVRKHDDDMIDVMTVDNGRGPAILGHRVQTVPFLPFASYDEHVFFAENVSKIVDLFGEVVRSDIKQMERLEQECISEAQHAERIV